MTPPAGVDGARAPDRTLLADVSVAVAALLVGGFFLQRSLSGADAAAPSRSADARETIARVTSVEAEPRLRPAGMLVWYALRPDEELARRDAVYVPEGALALLELTDGTHLTIAERSLVVIDRSATLGASLELLAGGIRGEAGGDGLAVRAAEGLARIGPGGELSVVRGGAAGDARVTVHAGDATLRAGGDEVNVASGEARAVGPTGTLGAVEKLPVELRAPAPAERIAPGVEGTAAVRLEWKAPAGAGETILEVSDGAAFDKLAFGGAAVSPAMVGDLGPGVWHWRIRGAAGEVLSEARWFAVSASRSPVPLQPRAGEVVYLPSGALYTWVWGPVPGAVRYRVEIAPERRFEKPVVTRTVSSPRIVVESGLPEGMYAWRVRALWPDGSESPPSRAHPFRLIVKPLPDAPRLLDPELRLGDEERDAGAGAGETPDP